MTIQDIAKYCIKNKVYPSEISSRLQSSKDEKLIEIGGFYCTLSTEGKKEVATLYWALSKEQSVKKHAAKKKADAKLEAKGKALVESMDTGQVALVKFNGKFNTRGMKVLEIEEGFIAGFYLDRVIDLVPADTPEKEGYVYTNPSCYTTVRVDGEWVEGKYEWDGKTFKKTRTYETKYIKFVKEIVETPIIIK